MRNAGDRSPGGSTGRRQRAVAPDAPGRASGNGGSLFTPAYRVNRPGSAPAAEPSETAYAHSEPRYGWADDDATRSTPSGGGYLDGGDLAGGGPNWPDEPAGTLYSWADDEAAGEPWPQASLPSSFPTRSSVSNAVRGIPPAPGDPPHVYPPGPFAAWNRNASAEASRSARREDPSRQLAAATITPDEFDTDFSLPAIRDPAPSARRTSPRGEPPRGGPGSRSRDALPPGRSGSERRSGSAHGGRRQARPASRRAGHHSVRIAIGAAAAIVVAVAVVLVLTSHSPNSTGSAGASHNGTHRQTSPSTSPSPSTLAGTWRFIAIRSTDPVKLTPQELFPPGFIGAGVSYRRSIAAKSQGCRSALIGTTLQAAVHRAGCTQAIRASYFSATAKTMATIGVFNLKTYSGAAAAASAAGRTEFVAQLPAHTGPTRQIGQGTGVEYAGIKGHYLVLVYAEFIDLQAPKNTTQRQRLDNFISQIISGTVNFSLSYRMANGKPPTG